MRSFAAFSVAFIAMQGVFGQMDFTALQSCMYGLGTDINYKIAQKVFERASAVLMFVDELEEEAKLQVWESLVPRLIELKELIDAIGKVFQKLETTNQMIQVIQRLGEIFERYLEKTGERIHETVKDIYDAEPRKRVEAFLETLTEDIKVEARNVVTEVNKCISQYV